MRRTKIRRRNKINFKNLDKKALLIITTLSIFIVFSVFVIAYFTKNFLLCKSFEKDYSTTAYLNEDTPFSLNKLVIFSSATVDAKELNNSVWNLDLSQFADICIYLNNTPNDNTSKNKIKQLYINNINISKTELGEPCLYQKTIQDFGKSTFEDEKTIKDRIDYNIIDTDETANYSKNELFNNLSNPIILGFYNKNIKTNFLNSNTELDYSGKILKEAKIPRQSIECNISFDINITNELNEEYICNVNFDIPFEYDNKSVYEDGYITKEIENLDNYKFLRLNNKSES